jgi:uncharacterized membrane protein YkoI
MASTLTRKRRIALTVACGIGMFQAGLLGAGATQPATPSNETPVTQPDESSETPADAQTCAIGSGAPNGIVITGDDGTSITITIDIDPASGVAAITVATDDGDSEQEGESSEPESRTIPSEAREEDDDDARGATESNDDEGDVAETDDSTAIEAGGEGELEVFDVALCEDDGDQPTGSTDPAEATGDEDTQPLAPEDDEATPDDSGATISPAAAIAIAQTVAEGDVQSLDLTGDGDRLVYEITVGDQLVIVDATTGELVPETDQP